MISGVNENNESVIKMFTVVLVVKKNYSRIVDSSSTVEVHWIWYVFVEELQDYNTF